ncbi:LOW QUALITY PROTEIN: Gag-pol fusion protein [Phytophthora megakarya]|uniref:Gag-pol fusion protein n=1 Tax=Phytophthora megakarya TaxID=4795 RepID=A0A225VK75_9STRA|nr:LOW QUALITY PROTEIN: Gag-pol fusion protein [Phytophthora megakarya]
MAYRTRLEGRTVTPVEVAVSAVDGERGNFVPGSRGDVGDHSDYLGDTTTPLENEHEVKKGLDEEDARDASNLYWKCNADFAAAKTTSPLEDEVIEENVTKMLNAGVIEEGNGAWGFPVVLVKKKDGEIRVCVDYPALNRVTVRDVYPLPRIDETIEALGGAQLFTALALKAGYWQILVKEENKDKTAFTTRGLYSLVRMPFGLTNAPSTFQRLMNNVLRRLTNFHAWWYWRHIVEVACVFERLTSAGLTLNSKKCAFATRKMEHLGHEISCDGVRPLSRLSAAVEDFPRLNDTVEAKRFIHLAGYHQTFVEGFGTIMAPMTKLLRKEAQESAFEQVKRILTTKPLLVYPDFRLPFRLVTDASTIGLGACLMQQYEGGWKSISYASKVTSVTEAKYGITELESLAVV